MRKKLHALFTRIMGLGFRLEVNNWHTAIYLRISIQVTKSDSFKKPHLCHVQRHDINRFWTIITVLEFLH